ncbi:MAG: DJ-1/PfpI family protein [Duncaniella sp.]|nr:DJ-1/PfpI family protein [Duncaniella sp.]
MSEVYVFLADGFEEIEALAPVDLMRRAAIKVTTVSVNGSHSVTGAHGICVQADALIADTDLGGAAMLVCPGGMPGASNLAACPTLTDALVAQYRDGRYVAAICAAPAVTLAPLGILDGHQATCYPGFEQQLRDGGATHCEVRVAVDGNVITSNGPSSAIPFALALITALRGPEAAQQVASGILL